MLHPAVACSPEVQLVRLFGGYHDLQAERLGRAGLQLAADGRTVAYSKHFRVHERNILFILTVVNLCAPTNLAREVKRPGPAITAAIKRTTSKYWGTFPPIYTLRCLCQCTGF